MKMIKGSVNGVVAITDYRSYIHNCQANQMPYRIPVNTLADVQLYIAIGATKPPAILVELLHTCGPNEGQIETLITYDYVVGQDTTGAWYAVFKNFDQSFDLSCFVIAITLIDIGGSDTGDLVYFSEEYCKQNTCNPLIEINGCYGNLENALSYDCEGIYFGTHAGPQSALGDTTIVYKHNLLLRQVEVVLSAIKNNFKQGRTRSFRTEKEKLYQFWAELVPAWYMSEIDAVFYRGEVYVGGIKYLVNETQFEKVEDCKQIWKPTALFKESCYQSFSCELTPCDPPAQTCCDPEIISAEVTEVPNGTTMNTVVIQCITDQAPLVTGTSSPVTGITAGSTVITCAAFAGVRITMERGHMPVYSVDETDGSVYYTKNLADDFITLGTELQPSEFVYIQTIPS